MHRVEETGLSPEKGGLQTEGLGLGPKCGFSKPGLPDVWKQVEETAFLGLAGEGLRPSFSSWGPAWEGEKGGWIKGSPAARGGGGTRWYELPRRPAKIPRLSGIWGWLRPTGTPSMRGPQAGLV